MPNFYRLTCVTLVAVAAALAGCDARPDDADGRPVVLTTFTVLADIARNVGGGHVSVESLTKPGAEIHGYEPTPGDITRASKADLIIDNGLGLENWFGRFVADLDVPHVVASDGIVPLPITAGGDTGRPDPHAWMSPRNAALYAGTIAGALARLDPVHAEDFQRNADHYGDRLIEVQQRMTDRLARLPEEHRALVTCEGAFSYLARDAGLTEKFLWPVNSDTQGTPQEVADVIGFVHDNGVPAVFCESTVSDKQMTQVVEATGARYGGTLYVDSLSRPDGPVPTYLDMIRHNSAIIADALEGDPQ